MLEHTSYMAAPLRQFTIPVRPCVEHGGEHWADWHWSECPDCLHASHEELHYQVAVGLRTLLQCMYPRHCASVQPPVTALDDSFAAHAPLQRLSNALRQNPKRGMTLAEAARIAGLEPAYFSRYFRQKTGKNFKAWNDARLMRIAAHRLKHSDDSISQIAAELDLDLTTFERVFRRILHTNAREFRRHQQES